jgi:hypothetical protein
MIRQRFINPDFLQMSDNAKLGFPEAAHKLGVSIGVLRRAIRNGKISPPPQVSATAALPAEWLQQAEKTINESPSALSRASKPKVPAFARYKGTSAWRKYAKRVREYAHFQAAAK